MTAGPDPFQSSGSLFFNRIDHSITSTFFKHISYQRGPDFVLYIRAFVWVYITILILDTVSSVDANQIYLVVFEKHCTKSP